MNGGGFDVWPMNDNINQGWRCPICGRGNSPWTSECGCHKQMVNLPSQSEANNPCMNCSNHPNNGGTGFCNCALPYMWRWNTGTPVAFKTTTTSNIMKAFDDISDDIGVTHEIVYGEVVENIDSELIGD